MSSGNQEEVATNDVQELASPEYETSSDEECIPQTAAPFVTTQEKRGDMCSLHNLSTKTYDSESDDDNVGDHPEKRAHIFHGDCHGSDLDRSVPPVHSGETATRSQKPQSNVQQCPRRNVTSLTSTYAAWNIVPIDSNRSMFTRQSPTKPDIPEHHGSESESSSDRTTSDGLSEPLAFSPASPEGADRGHASDWTPGPDPRLHRHPSDVAAATTNSSGRLRKRRQPGGRKRPQVAKSSLSTFSTGQECSSLTCRTHCRCAKRRGPHVRTRASHRSRVDGTAFVCTSPQLKKNANSHAPVGMTKGNEHKQLPPLLASEKSPVPRPSLGDAEVGCPAEPDSKLPQDMSYFPIADIVAALRVARRAEDDGSRRQHPCCFKLRNGKSVCNWHVAALDAAYARHSETMHSVHAICLRLNDSSDVVETALQHAKHLVELHTQESPDRARSRLCSAPIAPKKL